MLDHISACRGLNYSKIQLSDMMCEGQPLHIKLLHAILFRICQTMRWVWAAGCELCQCAGCTCTSFKLSGQQLQEQGWDNWSWLTSILHVGHPGNAGEAEDQHDNKHDSQNSWQPLPDCLQQPLQNRSQISHILPMSSTSQHAQADWLLRVHGAAARHLEYSYSAVEHVSQCCLSMYEVRGSYSTVCWWYTNGETPACLCATWG